MMLQVELSLASFCIRHHHLCLHHRYESTSLQYPTTHNYSSGVIWRSLRPSPDSLASARGPFTTSMPHYLTYVIGHAGNAQTRGARRKISCEGWKRSFLSLGLSDDPPKRGGAFHDGR